MKTAIKSIAAGGMITIISAFSAAAQEQRCAPYDILEYDLHSEGQTLQSLGQVNSEDKNHKIEMYGNTETGQWTLVENRGEENSCFYSVGTVFFIEDPRDTDNKNAARHSAMARHGSGNASNEAYEFFAHQGTGRWFLSRRISETKSTVVLAGDGYEEYNSPPFEPVRRVNDFRPGK